MRLILLLSAIVPLFLAYGQCKNSDDFSFAVISRNPNARYQNEIKKIIANALGAQLSVLAAGGVDSYFIGVELYPTADPSLSKIKVYRKPSALREAGNSLAHLAVKTTLEHLKAEHLIDDYSENSNIGTRIPIGHCDDEHFKIF